MAKDISIIFRTEKDTKDKVIKILKRNNLNLSALLNAYMLDTIQRDMVPINIRSKMRVYTKSMVTIPEIKKYVQEIIETKYKGRIDKAYLFGSYSRGEETGESDVDISIEAPHEKFDIGDMALFVDDLQIKIGKPVNMINRKYAKGDFLNNIKKDEICIYDRY